MISWITGTKTSTGLCDASQIEPPETPAPIFAVRAFKQAIFGTPHAKSDGSEYSQHVSTVVKETEIETDDIAADSSPTKLNSILITPGVGVTRRKTVSFGANVVDNEGKKFRAAGRTGLPNDPPGKFPSPWTPKVGAPVGEKRETALTATLYNAQTSSPNPRAKDDSDVTIDMTEPRSESGRFWKDRYFSYAEKSEKEMKRLVAKQQLAKSYAKKKDEEATQLTNRLVDEKRAHQQREQELVAAVKDYKERLRQALADNLRVSAELAAVKQSVGDLDTPGEEGGEDSSIRQPSSQSRRVKKQRNMEQRGSCRRSPAAAPRQSGSATPPPRDQTIPSNAERDSAPVGPQGERMAASIEVQELSPPSQSTSSPLKRPDRNENSKENIPPIRHATGPSTDIPLTPPHLARRPISVGLAEASIASGQRKAPVLSVQTNPLSAKVRSSGEPDPVAHRRASALQRIQKRRETKEKKPGQFR